MGFLVELEHDLPLKMLEYFAQYIQKNKWIGYVGLIVILIVALQLLIGGLSDYGVLSINETFKKYF